VTATGHDRLDRPRCDADSIAARGIGEGDAVISIDLKGILVGLARLVGIAVAIELLTTMFEERDIYQQDQRRD
jgi:hypothetical protein